MRKELFFVLISIFLLILMMGIVRGEVIVDPEVETLLQNQSSVWVSVHLKKDISNISFEGADTREEKLEISKKIDEFNKEMQSEIISSLSINDINITSFSSYGSGFTGYITEQGLEKLRRSPYVSSIRIPKGGGLAGEDWEVENNTENIEEIDEDKNEGIKVYGELHYLEWNILFFIIILIIVIIASYLISKK